MRRASTLLLAAALTGCPSGGDHSRTDSGHPTPDSGVHVDAGPPVDGGPDAGPPPCPCPVYPTACTEPEIDTVHWTPDDDGTASAQLFGVISCAQTSLHIAMYEADRECIVQAIDTQLQREPGLNVQIVIDDESCPRDTAGALTCALAPLDGNPRVTIVEDDRSALMHHKWAVADGTRLWISSGNFTNRSFCVDYNDSLVIEQPEVVARYEQVFQRLFTDAMFGPVAPEGATTGGVYTVYVSPETPVTAPPQWLTEIIAAVDAATTSIDVFVNAWTLTTVSDALIAAHARGVTVRAIVSPVYENDAPAQALLADGIEVRVNEVHAKIMVLDDHLVITGSANWSENAWSNNENSLWIDDAATATAYRARVAAVWNVSRVAQPAP